MSKPRVRVSDHAVLRYLERVGGFDIEALRRDIRDRVYKAAASGASAVVIDGFRYCIRFDHEGGRVITTVIDGDWSSDDHQVAVRGGGGK
jgi:hypothetical protein